MPQKCSIRKKDGLLTIIAVTVMVVLLASGFGAGYFIGQVTSTTPGSTVSENDLWLTQSIKLSGSTTVLPIADACATEFMNRHTGTQISVSGGGSGTGYSDTIDGKVNIGMASRNPTQTEINRMQDAGKPLWLVPIALDAVCVVVNQDVANSSYPINFSLELTGEIFSGIKTHWDEVDTNLPHTPIVVLTRPDGSGTRGTFEEFCMKPYDYTITDSAIVEEGNPEVAAAVAQTPYSIGYVGFGFLSENMYAVPMANTDSDEYYTPTVNTLASFTYPLSRYLYLITSSRPESGSLADRFIDYILSPEGQATVRNEGFLPLPEYPPAV